MQYRTLKVNTHFFYVKTSHDFSEFVHTNTFFATYVLFTIPQWSHYMNQFSHLSISKGSPFPLGISKLEEGINFSLTSRSAVEVILCLFDRISQQKMIEIPLSEKENKTGDIWHILIHQLPDNLGYAYRICGKEKKNITNESVYQPLNDPYAKLMATRSSWGNPHQSLIGEEDANLHVYLPIGDVYFAEAFDWEGDIRPNIPLNQMIIYEMHVRGFTQDESSHVKHPGTFLGVIEKIPHLLELGINAVELMPIQEFDELEYRRTFPLANKRYFNYWGYSTVNFFSPMNRYATTNLEGAAIVEFKMMVKELHRHKIEVILDVVFNHTAEGGIDGVVLSFKGIDNAIFYMLDEVGNYFNFSGCGNSFNANQQDVLPFIVSCLRYWVVDMHVDGFRFDLASALTRNNDGMPMLNPPLIAAITADPLLANTKLIAEPWDAHGLYQVGAFYPESKRWQEWNGKYRDSVRRFIKGSYGANGDFAMRLSGSEDLYHIRTPCNSINFITAHDGFTLYDLVSYNEKHNISNGEENRDGSNENDSWNCGIEGETLDKKIMILRDRQMRNFHLALMVSQGVPMLSMGDEYCHTKGGNNNTWCEDSPINWFLWKRLQSEEGFYRFYCKLIHYRKRSRLLMRSTFLLSSDVDWHGLEAFKPDWSGGSRLVAFTLRDHLHNNDLYIAFNAFDYTINLHLPRPHYGKHWHWVVNTANCSPLDIYENNSGPILEDFVYKMLPHSAIMLEACST
ncbi:MAG: glycogen-debranching protein [Parachlamydiaceae bacterium]|nr:glycogen-debranching protein [Parachlamydiaceae bacterium]